jgi:hypothetical protein
MTLQFLSSSQPDEPQRPFAALLYQPDDGPASATVCRLAVPAGTLGLLTSLIKSIEYASLEMDGLWINDFESMVDRVVLATNCGNHE